MLSTLSKDYCPITCRQSIDKQIGFHCEPYQTASIPSGYAADVLQPKINISIDIDGEINVDMMSMVLVPCQNFQFLKQSDYRIQPK